MYHLWSSLIRDQHKLFTWPFPCVPQIFSFSFLVICKLASRSDTSKTGWTRYGPWLPIQWPIDDFALFFLWIATLRVEKWAARWVAKRNGRYIQTRQGNKEITPELQPDTNWWPNRNANVNFFLSLSIGRIKVNLKMDLTDDWCHWRVNRN